MKSKLEKVLYIISIVLLSIGLLYYLVRFYDQAFVRDNTAKWLLDLNTLAIVLIALGALLMGTSYLVSIFKKEKQEEKNNIDNLMKYKSKRK